MPEVRKLVGYTACQMCGAQAELYDDKSVVCTRTAEAIAEVHALADKRKADVIAACEQQKRNAGSPCGYKTSDPVPVIIVP